MTQNDSKWQKEKKKRSATNRPTNRLTNRAGYRVTCTRLKSLDGQTDWRTNGQSPVNAVFLGIINFPYRDRRSQTITGFPLEISIYLENSSHEWNTCWSTLSVVESIHTFHLLRNEMSDALMNKAGHTATEVACRWAGAIFEVPKPFGQEQWGQRNKIIKKVKCERTTDRPTDKAGCRVACTRLKT